MLPPPLKRALHAALALLSAAAVAWGVIYLGARHSVRADLVIITPHWEGIRIEFERAFNEWRSAHNLPPVKIDWLDVGGTSDIVKFINSEFQKRSHGIDIDLFFGGGVDPYITFAEKGFFAPVELPAAILSNIPPDLLGVPLYDPRGLWYGAALSGFGILYNNVVLSRFNLPQPATWSDLADPRFYSWIGATDLRKSGSVHMMYEIILQVYGFERGMQVIAAVSGNARGFSQSASSMPKDVMLGDVAAGPVIDVYAWNAIAIAGPERLSFVLPQAATVVNPDAIAMLRGAPHPQLAREFISFVLSEDGQKLWMLRKNTIPGAPLEYELNKMPVWPSLFQKYQQYVVFKDSPFLWRDGIRYDTAKGSARWSILNDYIGTLFIDAHAECSRAWRAIMLRPENDPLRQMFFAHPLTEDQMLAAATNEYRDPAWRARTVTEWANDARRRYAHIIRVTRSK